MFLFEENLLLCLNLAKISGYGAEATVLKKLYEEIGWRRSFSIYVPYT